MLCRLFLSYILWYIVSTKLVLINYATPIPSPIVCYSKSHYEQAAKANARVRPWARSRANQQFSANAPQAGNAEHISAAGGSSPGARRQLTKPEKASGPETEMQAKDAPYSAQLTHQKIFDNGIWRDKHELTKVELVGGASELCEKAQQRGSCTVCRRTQPGTFIVEGLQASYLARDVVNLFQDIASDLDVARIAVTFLPLLLPSTGETIQTTRANID